MLKRSVIAAACLLSVGCVRQSFLPTAPSAAPAPAPTAAAAVDVRVLTQGTREPLSGALVTCKGAGCTSAAAHTDESGSAHMNVLANAEFTIYAAADGYTDFFAGVDGISPGAQETWTFYLIRR